MTVRPLIAGLALAALTSMTLTAAPAHAGDGDPKDAGKVSVELARAIAGTAKYHYEPLALKDGFVPDAVCVESPEGGMGFHYINEANIGSLDPAKPAALLYEEKNGKRKLVAVEYLVYDADQDLGTDDDRPTLFNQPFDGPMPGHFPGMPVHYDLHVWLYKSNPNGKFAEWNPRVSCPEE
ncbi:hypothetical protein [Streptomyces apocyni]|uniref:hypothetical protein n=1 Tax=Streptomyces apocyni TaxID=2654677 RepID=UPI0012EABF78|nr:hypothetical protein [Streptomyces apocyni]